MPRSRKPSVWIERRRTRRGWRTHHVRFERDLRRYPGLACGMDRELALRVRDTLRRHLTAREPVVEAVLADLAAGRITAAICARDLLAYLTADQRPDRHTAPEQRTLGELVDEYLRESQRDKRPRSHEIDRAALERLVAYFGRALPLAHLLPERLRAFHQQLQTRPRAPGAPTRPLSKTSEAIYLYAIRACCNRARHRYRTGGRPWLAHDPFEGISIYRVPSKGRYIHEDEFAAVRPSCAALVRAGYSLWDVLNVMRHQGLRTGAVVALDGRMIHRPTRHLHLIKPARLGIQRDADLKDTELWAPIHPAVWPLFERAPDNGRMFAGWSKDTIGQALRRICDRLAVPRFRPHDMKHTFVTNFLKGGGTLAMCSAITGTTEAMLRRVYGHLEGRVPPAEMLRVSYGSPTTPPKKKTARA